MTNYSHDAVHLHDLLVLFWPSLLPLFFEWYFHWVLNSGLIVPGFLSVLGRCCSPVFSLRCFQWEIYITSYRFGFFLIQVLLRYSSQHHCRQDSKVAPMIHLPVFMPYVIPPFECRQDKLLASKQQKVTKCMCLYYIRLYHLSFQEDCHFLVVRI